MRPLIGITAGSLAREQAAPPGGLVEPAPGYFIGAAYICAVTGAGGLAAVLPGGGDGAAAGAWAALLDGLILSGGGDVDPALYGEEPAAGLGRVDPDRDAFELALARAALEVGLPVLGICRGIQVLNVAAGGSLHQDVARAVPAALKHFQDAPRWHPTHRVEVAPGTLLARVIGAGEGAAGQGGSAGDGAAAGPLVIRVNSFHHQAVNRAAPGAVVSAVACDGVVEALEFPAHPFAIGVQWHPEGMWERDGPSRRLFSALVAAARERAARRAGRVGGGGEDGAD